jgi:hypothetical protein
MVAYEFYLCNDKGKERLFGILPERRKNLERINQESIMKWGRMVLDDDSGVDFNKYYCIQVEV